MHSSTSPATTRLLWLLAAALSASITLTNQVWVGRLTIYAGELEPKRERLHTAIINNRIPADAGTWNDVGGNSVNVRLFTVWVAEGIRRATGLSVSRAYFLIETVALFGSCLALFALLNLSAGPAFGFAGLLFYGCVLPLTYVLYFFHPWDKPSLVAWILALILTLQRRWMALAAVLAIGVTIKYDMIVFPLFVFFAELRRSGWRRTLPLVAALSVVSIGTFIVLLKIAPGGMEPRDWRYLSVESLRDLWTYGLSDPPVLALSIPAALAIGGYPRANDFARAGVHLALVLVAIYFSQTHFREFRAETPLFVVLLPAAMFGIERLSGGAWKVGGLPTDVQARVVRS